MRTCVADAEGVDEQSIHIPGVATRHRERREYPSQRNEAHISVQQPVRIWPSGVEVSTVIKARRAISGCGQKLPRLWARIGRRLSSCSRGSEVTTGRRGN